MHPSKDHPGARLLKRTHRFMEQVLDMGRLIAHNEDAFQKFRALVLREGNEMIRDFNAGLAEAQVRYTVHYQPKGESHEAASKPPEKP